MSRSKDDMLGILVELVIVFTQSLRIFTQSSKLWAQSIEKLGIVTKCVFIVNI
jgi:hypothetical protein